MATHDVPVLVGGKLAGDVIDIEEVADGATKKLMTATERTKLADIDTSTFVHTSDDQDVDGVKTFSDSPVVPTPTTAQQAATKGYADGLVDNLSGVTDAPAARDALGLGDSATKNVGTSSTTVAAGDAPAAARSAAISSTRFGRVVAWSGDSITAGAGSSNATTTSFVAMTPKITGNALVSFRSTNQGVPGNTSAQLLARIPTILATGPDVVHVQIGTNDAGNAVPLATFQANIIAIKGLCDAAGVPMTMGTVPPRGSAQGTTIAAWTRAANLWLRLWAPRAGVQLADVFGALVNPATGYLLAANDSGDGVHPSDAGHLAIANAVAVAMAKVLPVQPWPVSTAVSGFVVDPLMQANPGNFSLGAHTTCSLVAAVGNDVPYGQWKRFTTTNATGSTVFENAANVAITTGFTTGDVLLVACYLRADSAASINKVQILNQALTPRAVLFQDSPSATPGPLLRTFTVPTGDTTFYLSFYAAVPASGTTTLDVAALDVWNLTTLGLAGLTV